MSLSESHSSMKGNHQTNNQKMTSCSPAQSTFWPERDFMEILWENGQVVMQGQTNRSKRGMLAGALPLPSGRTKEKETRDAETPKVSRYGFPITDAEGNNLQPTGTQGQIVLGSQEDEMAPWLNSPMDDYDLEFLSEFSGSTYPLYSTMPADRNSSYGQPVRDAHGLEHETFSRIPSATLEHSRVTNNQLFSFPQQSLSLFLSSKCKDSSTMINNLHQDPIRDVASVKVHKQECSSSKSVPPNSSPCLMNFSHFTRPFALAKANLFGADRMRSCEKVSTAASSNPVESAFIDSTSGLKCNSALDGQLTLVADTADLGPSIQCSKEMDIARHLETICSDHARKNPSNYRTMDNFSNQRKLDVRKFQDSDLKASVLHETENCEQPVIASSSVCSANGAVPVANHTRSQVKRKCQEGEESEYASEYRDDDSMDVKRPSGQNIKPKRSRAAEVHNLSERRRRDRINEKMRALQELLPNCNKVDKASMLDEAIEYLKTLQMQVQIMSMGTGLCLPSMMIPAGLQNTHTPHMGPFSPMGVGMGMGMGFGYGMGMLDIMRSPLIPVPRMHGPPYPCPSIPGTPGLHGMPGSSSLQMFGIPRQPLPVTHPPNFIPFTGMATKVNSVPEEPVADVNPPQASDSTLKSSKNQQPDTSEQEAKMGTDETPAESSRQENKEFSELPLVSINNQHPEVGDHDEADGGNGIHLPP